MKQAVSELAQKLKSFGYTVYLSSNGAYGFYTDGVRVVCFDYRLGGFNFSGNYYPTTRYGSGWQLDDGRTFGSIDAELAQRFITAIAPYWAVGSRPMQYTTPEQHLKTYGKSSGYTLF